MCSSSVMLLSGTPKKTMRIFTNFVDLNSDSDNNMEMDSLETYQETKNRIPDNNIDLFKLNQSKDVTSKRLNLNAIHQQQQPKNNLIINCDDDKIETFCLEDVILSDSSIETLMDLENLSLRSNGMQMFPSMVLKLTSLTMLDLSDNNIRVLPPEINRLINLKELVLDHNVISVLPETLWDLRLLKILKCANNRLALPPDKFADMRAIILNETDHIKPDNSLQSKTNILTTLNLRGNRLKGNIILGNYGNLTELDLSENIIENLDLTAVEQLQILQCSRNNLTQLILFGKHLTSLIAGNNSLINLSVKHPALNLKHIDVSYNELEVLPDWLSNCQDLRSLFASNNNIKFLPEELFSNNMPFLHTIQLAYNQIQYLPLIQRKFAIQEFFLQNNSLSMLPENFFKTIYNLKVLNVSNNRLCDLPKPDKDLALEKLFLTANCLSDRSLEKITPFLKILKIFHGAYNNFTTIPEISSIYWCEIEELVFSGNKLLKLPEDIGNLHHLSVLRVHSNLLQNIPKLSNLLTLRVLDLAHNQLDRVDLTHLIPPNLKFLDLSCNTKLHVDSQQFYMYRSQRPMSLVDVSGKNRSTLPLSPSPFCENNLTESNWTVGFSETSGSKHRLYISQIRLPAFCNTEALFGMFDGENQNEIPVSVDKVVPRILLEERTVKETCNDYMKFTLLSTFRELKTTQRINAVLVHILKSKVPADYSFCGGVKKYLMKISTVGDLKVVLGRNNGPIRILPQKSRKTNKNIRTNPQIHYLNTVPDPEITEIYLNEQDEYLIIANKNIWNVITPENAIKEVSLQRNVILAAKRLQDLSQSYGAEENLSIIVVKFNLIGTDVDLLMKELRQTINKTNCHQSESGLSSTSCQPGCCCEILHNECINCLEEQKNNNNIIDDRSSPSGQSEQFDSNSSAKNYINQLNRQFQKLSPDRRSYSGGVAKALRSRKSEDEKSSRSEDTDSALSEEQFKCWEYMLEQNTQLLFDKELNTLTSTRSNRSRPNFLATKGGTLSRSNPMIASDGGGNNLSFLSKQFGSTRSFNPGLSRPASRLSLDKKLIGGPHAAYFGSLQRLMPYNLEYDFSVMQERGLADSLDLDRMQQYWGVTTTEL
ncbi:protein phosphatase PHLPP-like protein [Onthophagus taurus]|uniref:protein phosphatase PHLPP-like protein n=1 Tax=Onthophagus taurus TaxID=166361 RepID=UPI000C20A0AE|nr:protein phosphatase PHLPP-like protein [Onthophagus taurus]